MKEETAQQTKKSTLSHILVGCRFGNWRKLKKENGIAPECRAQARTITLISGVLALPGLLERALFDGRIEKTELQKDPVYIVGHWRTGTTWLQNLLTRDPQFAWFDPLRTVTISNCVLLGPILKPFVGHYLKGTRAMDNMEYQLDLPMEEVFAQATITDQAVSHMLCFPGGGKGVRYLDGAYTDEQTPEKQAEWLQAYRYILKKVTWIHGGKQLLLKSPENTCRIAFLKKNFPGAKFINIYRNPYKVVMSTIHMFHKEMGLFRLNELPSDALIEDVTISNFARMYKKALPELDAIPAGDRIDICYEDFCQAPETWLQRIYEQLGLGGWETALPYLRAHLEEQKDYQKNTFTLDDRLKDKINAQLGFYFERYGYEML